jgi:hypothetical protein
MKIVKRCDVSSIVEMSFGCLLNSNIPPLIVVVDLVIFRLHIRQVPGSNLILETCCPDLRFLWLSQSLQANPGNWPISNCAMAASSHVLSASLLTTHRSPSSPDNKRQWYINITITILDIIHRPVFYKIQLNSIGLSVPHRKHITSPLRVQQVNTIYRFVTMVY